MFPRAGVEAGRVCTWVLNTEYIRTHSRPSEVFRKSFVELTLVDFFPSMAASFLLFTVFLRSRVSHTQGRKFVKNIK